jgi:hypothetical protein
MKRFLFLLILPFMIACNSSNQVNESATDETVLGVKAIISPKYKEGSDVVFIVENTSDTSVYILQPSRLQIQRMLDSAWYDIRIQHCPCGAPCAPPRYVELKPYQQMDLNWNQKESWCKGGNLPGNDKTAYVPRGTYRFVLRINDSSEKEQADDRLLYAPFKIL